jgi:hypothetical protein
MLLLHDIVIELLLRCASFDLAFTMCRRWFFKVCYRDYPLQDRAVLQQKGTNKLLKKGSSAMELKNLTKKIFAKARTNST